MMNKQHTAIDQLSSPLEQTFSLLEHLPGSSVTHDTVEDLWRRCIQKHKIYLQHQHHRLERDILPLLLHPGNPSKKAV